MMARLARLDQLVRPAAQAAAGRGPGRQADGRALYARENGAIFFRGHHGPVSRGMQPAARMSAIDASLRVASRIDTGYPGRMAAGIVSDDRLLTIGDIADIARVRPRTVSRWITDGKLPEPTIRTPGGHVRYQLTEIVKALGIKTDDASVSRDES